MKKFLILITIAFLFSIQFSNAQTEKGTQTFGLNLGVGYIANKTFRINPFDNSTSNQSSKMTSFNIGPNYGYFIADKIDIGASLSYAYEINNISESGQGNVLRQSDNDFNATVYIRKYFMCEDKFGFRVGPYLGYARQNQKTTNAPPNEFNDINSTVNQYEVGGNFDLVYYPSKKMGVSVTLANLQYNHDTANNNAQGNGSGDALNFNFISQQVSFSIFYVWGGK